MPELKDEMTIVRTIRLVRLYQPIFDVENEAIPFGDPNANLYERSLAFWDRLMKEYDLI